MNVWRTILSSVQQGEPCVLVSVASTKGSAPRDEGAHMVVTRQGYRGTIGGGTLEWRAIAAAQLQLAAGRRLRSQTFALGPDLGQCCGGRVDVVAELFTADDAGEIAGLAAQEAQGPFEAARHGRHLQFGETRRAVYLFGAGHVGRALVLALAPLPFAVRWIDPRPEAFPALTPENVTKIAPADPVAELDDAAPGSLAFVMSHSHALDLAITAAALGNANLAHVGLIGSASKRARFERRLADAAVPRHRIAALICPIGIAGIDGKQPEIIAAATAAQILVLDQSLRLATTADPPQHVLQKTGDRL